MLDLDGTLLDLHFDTYFWEEYLPLIYAEKQKISLTEATAIIKKESRNTKGTLQWYCLNHWNHQLSLNILNIKKTVIHKLKLRPYAKYFLDKIKKMNKSIIMVTNAHPEILTLKMQHTPITHYFDKIISSSKYNTPKEHPNFWLTLEKDVSFEKKNTLFIDDDIHVLNTAKNHGIRFIFAIDQPNSEKKPQYISNHIMLKDYRQLFSHLKT